MMECVKTGVSVMFLDVDQVLFDNPLNHVKLGSDVMVSKDCPGGPDKGLYGNINLGTIYFRELACMAP